MIKSFFSSIFVFFCFLIFEVVILSNIVILPAVPDLMLIVCLYISLHNGIFLGETTGFFSGMMIDFLSSGPFGLNCLIRTIIGFLAGLLNRTVNTSGFFIPMLLGICGTFLKYLLLLIVSFFFPNNSVYTGLFSHEGIFELVSNALLSPVIFWFLSLFNSYLLLEEEKSE